VTRRTATRSGVTCSAGAGRVLRTAFRVMQRVRAPRPIHPAGVILAGTVRWVARSELSGIRWIDEPADGEVSSVAARLSRSVGLPRTLPDVIGLALHVDGPAGAGDLELASTGSAFPFRFALFPVWRASSASLGTLLPYRGGRGAVLIMARPLSPRLPRDVGDAGRILENAPWRLGLSFATPSGPWRRFALLELQTAPDQNDSRRFDAGRKLLPGAAMYRWIRELRQPSYDAVQRER
jgi:hypothetical protein